MLCYEYPFNERIRTWLRLDALFARALHFSTLQGKHEHHAALRGLFEIIDMVATRSDLKSELLKELERQRQNVLAYRANPDVSDQALNDTMRLLDSVYDRLLAVHGKLGRSVRHNDWLMAIKNRSAIPGGVCEFDLPAYHHWLHEAPERRVADIQSWLEPLIPLHDTIQGLLKLLRGSASSEDQVARNGLFLLNLSNLNIQMARVEIDPERRCNPEISANKYALNIRFISTSDDEPCHHRDIDFRLTLCSL